MAAVADIFLAYAREDEPRVKAIAGAPRGRTAGPCGGPPHPPRQALRRLHSGQLDASRRIIVVWSRASIGSQFVRDAGDRGSQWPPRARAPRARQAAARVSPVQAADSSATGTDNRPRRIRPPRAFNRVARSALGRVSASAAQTDAPIAVPAIDQDSIRRICRDTPFRSTAPAATRVGRMLVDSSQAAWLGRGGCDRPGDGGRGHAMASIFSRE